ncbi:MAG: helix-turn-helix domain-containing protein [Azonexaceae bacterium]|nr:helix-turn-helix domain-containing protein [Azonexaceae bacterium]
MLSREFSTMSQPVESRQAFWANTTASFFGNLDAKFDSTDNDDFDARLVAYQMDSLKIFRVIGPAHRVWSKPATLDSPVADFYKLVLQVKGSSVVEQCNKSIVLTSGEWTIYDPRLSYAISNRESMEVLVLLIPRHPLRTFKLGEVQCPLSGHPELESMQTLFSNFLRSLSLLLPTLPDASASTFADTTMALLVSTLATRQTQSDLQRCNPDVMRVRVKQFIHSHLVNTELSIEMIAQELNCSKRYLHRIFEDEGVTLDRYIWNARLERCRDELTSRSEGIGSISKVAFAWGFNSNAHFCRTFKSRFGVSPRDFQAAATKLA